MWDTLWRWQCEHRGFRPTDAVANHPRPPEPDRALFVATADCPIAGVGLHETRAYVFLDDLTTNPEAPARLRYDAVEHVLRAAQQYAVSVGKPLCAFTSVPSLYRIARRLGFVARPSGALLISAIGALTLEEPPARARAKKKRAAQGPRTQATRSTLDGENVRLDRQHTQPRVPRQAVKRIVKLSNGQDERSR